jgi:hypothetical protein
MHVGPVRRYRPMRAVECPCGEHVEADTDARLVEQMKEHSEDAHPDRYQESELRLLVTTTAYDAAA